jgi:hypothetical protein
MPNLWPDDFGTSAVTPPITILREQAEYLGKQTKGMVDGRVLTAKGSNPWADPAPVYDDPDVAQFQELKGEEFLWHRFYLEVPTLDNYRYLLFTVVHSLDLYPLRLHDHAVEKTFRCNNQTEFEQRLRDILASDKTKKIIRSILAQVEAVLK